MKIEKNNSFWQELPSADDPAAFHLPADTLLRLHTYWLGMFTVASAAYAEHGRPGVNDVRALAGRVARLLTIAAEQRGYDSSCIMPGHEAATNHLGEKAAQADKDDGELATHTKPDAPAYQRAVDELGRLRIKLVAERQRDIAADATPQDLAAAVRRLADLIEAGKIRASAHTEADRVRVMAVEMFNREDGGRYRELPPDQQSVVDTYRDLAGAMPAIMGKAPASNPAPTAAELRQYADTIAAEQVEHESDIAQAKRTKLNAEYRTITLPDGTTEGLTDIQYRVVSRLIEADGGWRTGDQLREYPGSSERPGDIINGRKNRNGDRKGGLPQSISKHIESSGPKGYRWVRA